MRKLSKKISMLMVLAMLVSLFSGVVSASAASSWSFYNKTADAIVAVNETIEMDKDEFADFDLYKDGKTVDTDVYTVKYETSDADVVWVDAKNGKLRADKAGVAEAGDTAKITAVITNKTTGITAKRSFIIEIAEEAEEVEYAITTKIGDAVLGETIAADKDYALTSTVTANGEEVEAVVAYTIDGVAVEKLNVKEGEYTLVVTATIDGEVVATAEYAIVAKAELPEIVETKQTTLNSVEITFNDEAWVANAVANKELIKVAQVMDGVDVAELVKTVEAKKDAADVLVVTLYNNLAAGKTYKFAYDGFECAASVVGAGSQPASIKVVFKKVPVNVLGQAEIKVYNAAGIDITTDALKYAAEFSTDENTNTFCDVQPDGSIYFFEVGKTAVVKAKFDMGWDEEGNKITDLEAVGEYTSVEEFTYSKPNGYALSNQIADKNKDLTYTTGTLKMPVSDNEDNFRLVAKYVKTPYQGDAATLYIDDGEDGHSDAIYTYKSTNESVLLVEESSGLLQACKPGSASIYIKKGDTVVGSVSVQVEAGRKLTTFSASIADKKLATAMGADTAEVVVTAKDQYTANYPADKVTYTLVLNTLKVGTTPVTLDTFFTGLATQNSGKEAVVTLNNDGKFTLTLNDAGAAFLEKIQTVSLTLKAKDIVNNIEKPYPLSVSIKNNVGSDVASRDLTVSASEMDVALSKKNFPDYQVKINLVELDADKYDKGFAPIVLEEAATTGNPYSVVITKPGSNWNAANDALVELVGDTIVISARTADAKLENGTYKIQLFTQKGDKMQPSTPKYLTIKDSTPAVTAVVTTTNIASEEAIDKALEFYINGAKIDASKHIDAVVINDTKVALDSKVYVKTVKVTFKTTVLNGESQLGITFDKDVEVNQLFTITQ